MKTRVQYQMFEVRTMSNWATAVVCLVCLMGTTPAWASSNPWARAIGEAKCLHDVTEDLENRTHRLFPNSPATRLTCVLDDVACQLLEMVKCGADWGQLQAALRAFENIQMQVCRLVAADCHMVRDRTIANYLRMVDDRFRDLVRDLSKCKPPVPDCISPYPPHYHPSLPGIGHDDYPRIPELAPQPREVHNYDPRFVNPNVHPAIPQQWQGAMPQNSYYPRSTYDFDVMSSNRDNSLQSRVGNSVPVDRRSTENNLGERPIASEIMSLLMSRALR